MVREVVHDVLFLGQKSEPATQADKQVAIDLLDTLKAHEEGCVGMAANMIGALWRRISSKILRKKEFLSKNYICQMKWEIKFNRNLWKMNLLF